MPIINSPCYKCENRKVTTEYNCHSHCDAYEDYKKKLKTYNESNRQQPDLFDVLHARTKRVNKAKGGKS